MLYSALSTKPFKISLIIGWLILVIAQIFLLSRYYFPQHIIIIDSLVCNTLLLIASIFILNITKYYPASSYQYTSVIGSCLVLSGLWLFIANSFLKILLQDSKVYLSFLQNSLIIRTVFTFLLLTIVAIAATLWYSWGEKEKAEKRKTDVDKLSREAELFKLRQQLQPHFLFNSLNSINALIGVNPPQARKMVQQLSDFLRGILKKEESQMVTLEEEINYLNLYLEIEKIRFGNRLITAITMSETSKTKLLPTLLLQPIIENAIKFGLYDTTDKTLISINCNMNGNDLYIEVRNPYDQLTAMPNRGTGFGLSSIKRRLYLLFGRDDLLVVKTAHNIFQTIVKIPQPRWTK